MHARDEVVLGYSQTDSPIGRVHVATQGEVVVGLEFGDAEARLLPMLRRRFGGGVRLVERGDCPVAPRLARYFEGEIDALTGPTTDGGGTAFQRRVWGLLAEIPPGQTRSYLDMARALGDPGAVRAVGLANGRNPVSLIVPCHRVIGADGSMTGYGGGIERKRWLLEHEGVLLRL